ncbi:MAG: DNA-directed RNA polymerase subunit P [Thermoprotei archaeon]|nr:MAG: DNA-directed RNA polymerase subunit P [Thermoprotei archaeon]
MGVKYKCGNCGKVFDEEEMKAYGRYYVRCPHCGYSIIYKVARSYRIVKAI